MATQPCLHRTGLIAPVVRGAKSQKWFGFKRGSEPTCPAGEALVRRACAGISIAVDLGGENAIKA